MYMISYSVQRNGISESKRIFKVRTHENGTFKFWRLDVKQTKYESTIFQNLNAWSTSPKDIKKGRSLRKNYELSPEEKTDLKILAGQIMWVATQTRLYASFDACRMSNTGKSPKVKLQFETNKSLLKFKWKTGSISFSQPGKLVGLNIVCFSDAIYARL